MKKVQLKLIKETKNIHTLTHYHFFFVKNHMNENRFPFNINNGER